MIGVAAAAVAIAACDDVTPPAPCVTGGFGNLQVNLVGQLPDSLTAEITVTGPGGVFALTGSQLLSNVASGEYTVTAVSKVATDSTISFVYGTFVEPAPICVRDGQTRTTGVLYDHVYTSAKLWFGAGYYSLAFNRNLLGATATLAPSITAGTRGGSGITFDKQGNLWLRGQSASDPALMRFSFITLGSMGSAGTPTPDRTININGLTCVGPGALAFDPAGNLWMSIGCQGRIVRLTPTQLGQSGVLFPAVQITGLVNPQGIAFDSVGNLWVADQNQLKKYLAPRLAASINTAADLAITFTTPTPPAGQPNTLRAFHLAFAPDGEFWVSSYEQKALYRVEPAVSAATGLQAATPTRIVYLSEFTSPRGFAFDNQGGLFIGYEQSKFARLSPAQLDANSTPAAPTVPQRIFASGSILGFGDDAALFPAPPTTPLYHRVP